MVIHAFLRRRVFSTIKMNQTLAFPAAFLCKKLQLRNGWLEEIKCSSDVFVAKHEACETWNSSRTCYYTFSLLVFHRIIWYLLEIILSRHSLIRLKHCEKSRLILMSWAMNGRLTVYTHLNRLSIFFVNRFGGTLIGLLIYTRVQSGP